MQSITLPAGLLLTQVLNPHTISVCALFIGITLLGTISIGKVLKWLLHIPPIAGQIIAGIILGPSLVNIAQLPFFAHSLEMSVAESSTTYLMPGAELSISFLLMLSALLTVPYLLWLAGHETDIAEMKKVGAVALLGGFLGAVLPILGVGALLYLFFSASWSAVQAVGMGLVFAATSVSIPVAMLLALGKMHLKSSKATLGAAVVDDILAVIFLSIFIMLYKNGFFDANLAGSSLDITALLSSFGLIIIVLTSLCLVGYFVLPLIIRALDQFQMQWLIPAAATIYMLLAFSFVELVGGLAGITGAYFAGLFHRLADPEHRAQQIISPFVENILLPLFLGSIGYQVNMKLLGSTDWLLVGLLLVVAILSKLIGCWLATTTINASTTQSERWTLVQTYLFGSSMVARGEVGLVISTILYGMRLLSPQQYVIGVVVIVLTTIAAPIFLALGFQHEKAPVRKVGTK